MMILKTSLLSLILVAFISVDAWAFNEFDCLRDMLPVTSHGTFQSKRKGVEPPFMIEDKYMVFPEVRAKKVTGFYIYDHDNAWYFDAIQSGQAPAEPIASLNQKGKVLYQMVVQPNGLETLTIYYMPGFDARRTNQNGAMVLGASVLPVVGAFVSRPEKADYFYQNPSSFSDDELKGWVFHNMSGRKPASANQVSLNKQMVKLIAKSAKVKDDLYGPLKRELELREKWIESKNLDDQTFKSFNRALQTTCARSKTY